MTIEKEIWWALEPLEKQKNILLPFPKSEIFIFLNDSETFQRYSLLINMRT